MNSNSNNKRNFEPDFFSPFNPIKKIRLSNGREKPSFPSVLTQSDNSNFLPAFPQQDPRPMYKVHHKCKENSLDQFKPQQFKAKPMPNFSNPFVPQHFKAPATTFQEFNLSCYSKDSRKSSKFSSRCETPESLQFSSFWSDKNISPSPKKAGFKARPMPNFSQPFFPVLSRSANSPFARGAGNERSREENDMDIDQAQNMDIE